MIWKALNLVSLSAICLFAIFDASDLVQFFFRKGDYHFGTEVAGFRYTSVAHFVGSSAAILLLVVFAIAAPRFFAPHWVTAIRVTIAVVLTAATFWISA